MPFEQAIARSREHATRRTRLRAVQLLKEAAYPGGGAAAGRARHRSAGRGAARGDRRRAEHLSRRADRAAQARRRWSSRSATRCWPSRRSRPARWRSAPRPVPRRGADRAADRARATTTRASRSRRSTRSARWPSSPAGAARRELLRASGPDLAALIGVARSGDCATPRSACSAASSRSAPQDEPVESTVGDAVITALNDNDRAVQGGGDAGARRDALRARRRRRSTDLFAYYGKGDAGRGGARRAGAHRAPVERAAVRRAARVARRRRCAASRSKGLARIGDASQLRGDPDGARQGARPTARRWPAPSPRRCSANAPIDRARRRAQRSRSCATRRSSTWSSSRPGARRRSRRQLQDPDPQIRARRRRRRSGSPAIRRRSPLVEPLLKDPRSAGRARRRARAVRCELQARDQTLRRREAAARASTIVRRSTSPAICSARCSSTIAAASARAASSSRSRPTSASPIRPVTPRRTDDAQRAAVRRSRARLRLSELRHPLPRERRHRGARVAGRGADSRARSARRHRRDAAPPRARDERARRAAPARRSPTHDLCRGPGNLTMAMGITLAENRRRPARRSPVRRGPRHRASAPIAWGPRDRHQRRDRDAVARVGRGPSRGVRAARGAQLVQRADAGGPAACRTCRLTARRARRRPRASASPAARCSC